MKDNDAIWRRIVERNLINPKDKKKKKKTPKGVGQYSDLSEDEDEDDEASGTEDGSRRESEELNGDKEREVRSVNDGRRQGRYSYPGNNTVGKHQLRRIF